MLFPNKISRIGVIQGELFTRLGERDVKVVVGGPFNSGILVGGTTWNYETAPSAIVDRVEALTCVCAAHLVPLPAAALQFPLAHPVVTSVIPGTRTPEEFAQVLSWYSTEIPASFWSDLKSEGLLSAETPTPS